MKLQFLPTTFDEKGRATGQQHLSCLVVDDSVAIDAGSLATATSKIQKEKIRDVVLTHAHLDHIAGLPLFIDDLFAGLREPVRVHALEEVIETLEKHIFNWEVYPRFTKLNNDHGKVLCYEEFDTKKNFKVAHLKFRAIAVNHKVPSVGFVFTDSKTTIGISGDTAEMDKFWQVVNKEKSLDALLVECSFPEKLDEIAHSSHHLTARRLKRELEKFKHEDCPIYAINLKPAYYEQVAQEIKDLGIERLKILQIGQVYNF